MLKLRPIEVIIQRDIMNEETKIGDELLTQELYCTEGIYKTSKVVEGYDVFSENISVISQMLNTLKRINSPTNVDVDGFVYKIDEKTKSALRDISELSDDDTYFEFSCVNGESLICGSEAKSIRKKMLDETQVVFRKFKNVSDVISGIKDDNDIQCFDLIHEWDKA